MKREYRRESGKCSVPSYRENITGHGPPSPRVGRLYSGYDGGDGNPPCSWEPSVQGWLRSWPWKYCSRRLERHVLFWHRAQTLSWHHAFKSSSLHCSLAFFVHCSIHAVFPLSEICIIVLVQISTSMFQLLVGPDKRRRCIPICTEDFKCSAEQFRRYLLDSLDDDAGNRHLSSIEV